MKKTVLAVTLVSLSLFVPPVFGVEAHHPEQQGKQQVESQKDAGGINATMQQMQEMRNKIGTENNQEIKNKLMHRHMQMMQEGMQMMTMMGQGMMGKQDTGSMPMEDRMTMMENKMAMMEKMMQGGGMMGGQGMMMGGASGNQETRMAMMEKEMKMMQEIMKGMLLQQQMMMNK